MSERVKTDEERDDEVVERVAAAMWWQEFGYDRGITWEQRVQQELDHRTDPSWSGPVARYRRLARAALSAITSGDPVQGSAKLPENSAHSADQEPNGQEQSNG